MARGEGPARVEHDVRLAYDIWSATYDAQSNATRDLSTRVLQLLVPNLDGLTVVEAGCGSGLNSRWLAPKCRRLIGLDFSPGMLAVARAKVRSPNACFVLHDVREGWPLADGSAGLVAISLVLEHVDFVGPVLRSVARVMQDGAVLVISELHPDRVAAGARAHIRSERREIVNFLHTVGEYVTAAEDAGLRSISIGEWSEQALGGTLAGTDEAPLILSLCFEKD